jgi:hypothetical protein
MINQEIWTYCAEEVARQHRGPIQVAWMLDAWEYAMDKARFTPGVATGQEVFFPSLELIKLLGKLVERQANDGRRWRTVGVTVGDHVPPLARDLPDRMKRWHDQLGNMSPEEAYKEFELIHPFQDGNGRVGKIIYNWLKMKLHDPVMPPNFFGGGNP